MAAQPPERLDALARVNAALEEFGTAWRNATEANYVCGSAALSYLRTFLSAGPKANRTAAVENLADEAARWDEDALTLPMKAVRAKLRERIGRLVQVSAAVELLTGTADVPHDDAGAVVPWGWCRELGVLVERVEGKAETWAFVAGVEGAARSLWADVRGGRLGRDSLAAAVANVVADRAAGLRAAAEEQARLLRDKEEQARQEARRLRAQAEAAGKEVDQFQHDAGPDPSAELNAAVSRAWDDMIGKRRAAQDAQAAEVLAAQQAARAEEEAVRGREREDDARRKAEERKRRAADRKGKHRADPAEDEPAERPERSRRCLLTMARVGNPKDVAALVVDMVASATQPDDVLAEILRLLDRHPSLGAAARHVIQAARLQQARRDAAAGRATVV